ncbi:putative pectate lyase 12 [Glycine max]|nr:putative pectate lyase 12 [Glycine max]
MVYYLMVFSLLNVVIAVPDGLKAWEMLKKKAPELDLILTEVELPAISGFALFSLIMEHDICKRILVIMMSSHDSVNMALKCMLNGAINFLIKPIRKNELRNLWQHISTPTQNTTFSPKKLKTASEDNSASNKSNGSMASSKKNNECSERLSEAQKPQVCKLLCRALVHHQLWKLRVWILDTNGQSSPEHYGFQTESDRDGISIFGPKDIWIDHYTLSRCKDGLIDAVMGSIGITINNMLSHHNEVMLLGHSDDYLPDSGMQVTIAFNHFGEKLVQRMPRCRRGYIHVINNDFTEWEMYAIGGSGEPTINSQGNRYMAPENPFAKEVTKRVDTQQSKWKGWNWRSEGDILLNGAFFVASGEELEVKYEKTYIVQGLFCKIAKIAMVILECDVGYWIVHVTLKFPTMHFINGVTLKFNGKTIL